MVRLSLLPLTLLAVYGSSAAPLDVRLNIGTFRGVASPGSIEKWLGLPYALPPVGSLRFKAPVPITKASNGVSNASTFGNACPQPSGNLGAPIGESCLFLNVFYFIIVPCSLVADL